jgi:lysophospholipase L1-like esterase
VSAGLGVLALGDSITNGGGELQWGVALQSWALWTARGLGLPYTGHAVDGGTIRTVLDVEIPRHEAAHPEGPYDLGCLYIGANDVRGGGWDPAAFAAGHAEALGWLARRCARTLAVLVPLDLGRPRAGATVREANAIVEGNAREAGALVLDLRDFGARNLVMVDAVHPTAFGQIAIAERALAVLAADGMVVKTPPRTLIAYETTRWRRLRGDATYGYRQAKQAARIAARRLSGRSG